MEDAAMTWRHTILRLGGMVMALSGLVAVGCGGDQRADTQSTPAVDEQAVAVETITGYDYVWVRNGRVVAVRRAPVPEGAYGAHGVDYSLADSGVIGETP
jgi:hypothetical protein